MIKKFLTFFIALIAIININQAAFSQQGCNWSGSWQTNKGAMNLTVKSDGAVEGNFDNGGKIEGFSSGRFLIGAWYNTANKTGGKVNMLMSKDCSTFTADWNDNINETDPTWNMNSFTGQRGNVAQNTPDIQIQKQTFSINNIPIAVELDPEWSFNKEESGDIIFTSKKYPDDIVIILINKAFTYNNNSERNAFLQNQNIEAQKIAQGKIETDSRQLSGNDVQLIKIPQGGMKTMIFLPEVKDTFFMLTTTYTDPQKMAEGEGLLINIMNAMFNAK